MANRFQKYQKVFHVYDSTIRGHLLNEVAEKVKDKERIALYIAKQLYWRGRRQ